MKIKIEIPNYMSIEKGDIVKYDDEVCIVSEFPKINNPYPITVIRLSDGEPLFGFSDYEKLSRTSVLIAKSVNSIITISEVK